MPKIIKPSVPLEYIGRLNRLKSENELLKRQAEAVASTESTKVSHPYAVGELLTYQGVLYRVALPIACGGMITPGTNCIATTLANEINKAKEN